MMDQFTVYFAGNSDRWLSMTAAHIKISIISLLIAAAIAIPAGVICVYFRRTERYITALFGILRVIPSLAILLLVLPVMGTGTAPATVALVVLAIPPILINTVTGLSGVPDFMLETAEGIGMEPRQVWTRVRFPLAMPLIITGLKTAAVEIIASATLASKIGAGGLGDLIFTGIGLFKTDLLIIGGASVAMLSLLAGLLFGAAEKIFLRHKII